MLPSPPTRDGHKARSGFKQQRQVSSPIEERGYEHGHDLEGWLRAEAEVDEGSLELTEEIMRLRAYRFFGIRGWMWHGRPPASWRRSARL